MRAHVLVAVLATTVAAILAAPASALDYQVNVTITDGGCSLDTPSVSRRNTGILFHVINNGSVPHSFSIWGVSSGTFPAHREGHFGVQFRGPGTYRFQCLVGRNPHAKVFKRGIFTIRKT
jgi:plastocyanin